MHLRSGGDSRRCASVVAVAASILSFLPPAVADGEIFPTGESFGLKLVWRESLGSGHSGITVVDGRVATMFSDGESDYLVVLDTNNGEEIWRYRIAPTYQGRDGSEDGPHSTPVVEDGLVYGLGPRGHLFAVSLADGKEIWTKSGNVAVRSLRLLPPVGDDVLSMVRGPKRPVQFHVGWDRYDARSIEYIDIDLPRDSRDLADLLEEKGYAWTGGETAEGAAAWGSRADKVLKSFFPLRPGN